MQKQNTMTPLVIKIGGAVLSEQHTLAQFFAAIADYQQLAKRKIVIVHGGGNQVDELLQRLQFSSQKKIPLKFLLC